MRLISAQYNLEDLRDPQGALDFFLSNEMSSHRIWVDLSAGAGNQCPRHRVHMSLSDVVTDIEVAFDTPEEALAFAAARPFGKPCDDQKGRDFYSRFIAKAAKQ